METEIKSKSYTLRGEKGEWLGQVVLTSDGMFASVTDYGNFSFSWRSHGSDFREFLCSLNTQYFGNKMYQGMSYILIGKKCEKACERFAEKILPPLQKVLSDEIERGEAFLSSPDAPADNGRLSYGYHAVIDGKESFIAGRNIDHAGQIAEKHGKHYKLRGCSFDVLYE